MHTHAPDGARPHGESKDALDTVALVALQLRFLATVPVGEPLETPAASNLRAPTHPMARDPTGKAKTHSTPSHDDGVEHK